MFMDFERRSKHQKPYSFNDLLQDQQQAAKILSMAPRPLHVLQTVFLEDLLSS